MKKGDIADPGRFVDGKVPLAPPEPPPGEPKKAPTKEPHSTVKKKPAAKKR